MYDTNPLIIIQNVYLNNIILVEGTTYSKEVMNVGFPLEHKHKLCCLRQELIDVFVDARYMMFIKYAAFNLQQLNMKKQKQKAISNDKTANSTGNTETDSKEETKEDEIEADEAKKIVESMTESTGKPECK